MKKTLLKTSLLKTVLCAAAMSAFVLTPQAAKAADPLNLPGNYAVLDYPCYGYGQGLAVISDPDTELRGYRDIRGDIVIPERYDFAQPFSEGLAFVSEPNSTGGYIDSSGRYIIPPYFSYGNNFTGGMAIVNYNGGRTQIINQKGEFLLNKDYQNINYNSGDGYYYCNPREDPSATDIYDGKLNLVKAVSYQVYGSDGWRGMNVDIKPDKGQGASAYYTDLDKTVTPPEPCEYCEIQNGNLVFTHYPENGVRRVYCYDKTGALAYSGDVKSFIALGDGVFYAEEIPKSVLEKMDEGTLRESDLAGQGDPFYIESGVKEPIGFHMYYNLTSKLYLIGAPAPDGGPVQTWLQGAADSAGNIVIPMKYGSVFLNGIQGAADSSGQRIVGFDKLNKKIDIYDTDGKFVKQLGGEGLYGHSGIFVYTNEAGDQIVADRRGETLFNVKNTYAYFSITQKGVYSCSLGDGQGTVLTIVDKNAADTVIPDSAAFTPSAIEPPAVSDPAIFIKPGSYIMYQDGFKLFDLFGGHFAPVLKDGVTFVPYESLQSLGFGTDQFYIKDMAKSDKLTVSRRDMSVTLYKSPDNTLAKAEIRRFDPEKNSFVTESQTLIHPGGYTGGHYYLPLRYIAETLGMGVDYKDGIVCVSAGPAAAAAAVSGGDFAGVKTGFEKARFTPDDIRRIDASLATQPYLDKISAELLGLPSAANIANYSNTPEAYPQLVVGAKDLLLVTEPSKNNLQLAKDNGLELEAIPFAKEGFVFIVNADNPVTGLTSQQLKDIYSGKLTNWKDVGGIDAPIIPYQRNQDSGSQTIMEGVFMKDGGLMKPPTEQVIGAMSGLIDAVAAFKPDINTALGYSVYYYATTMYGTDKIRLLSVDGVSPSPETIGSGEYPLTVNYYLVKRKNDTSARTKALIDYILSPEGQRFVGECGMVPVRR